MLAQNIDHYNDLLSAACRFEQIVTMWNLVTSQRGAPLLARIARSPDHLLSAMTQNFLGPPEEKTNVGSGGYSIRRLDSRPELKLRTLISVADRTRSPDVLKAAVDYTSGIMQLWEKSGANCRAATEILNYSMPQSGQR